MSPAGKPGLNTATVRPAPASPAKRFIPGYVGEPIVGHVTALRNPDGSWVKPGGKFQPGAHLALRPFYGAGPAGDPSTQWNAAQVAKAKQIQAANYGLPGTILRSLLPGGLDEGGAKSPGEAVKMGADVASLLVPGGAGAVKVAGLFGLGLKGLRVVRTGEKLTGVVPKAAHVFEATPGTSTPEWISFFGKDAPGISRVPHPSGDHFVHRDASGNADGILTVYKNEAGKPTRLAVVVRPDARRQGIATTLYGAAEDAGVNVRSVMGKESLTPEGAAFLNSLKPPTPVQTASDAFATRAAQVREGMKGAPSRYGVEKAARKVEESAKVKAASDAFYSASDPYEALAASGAALRGKYAQIDYKGLKELTPNTVKQLMLDARDHPGLGFYQSRTVMKALQAAVEDGIVPRPHEQRLIAMVFGEKTAAGIAQQAARNLWDKALSVANIPRSLSASFDFSAPFRQGLVVSTRHPVLFARNLGPMFKAFGSEGFYQATLDEIHARPSFPMMVQAKLPFTELGRDVGAREERFASDYAEKLTGGKYGPVRASGRAYTGFLDKTRADVFDHLIQRAQGQGVNVTDQHFLESLGRYIGSATGRGSLKMLEGAARELNAAFFSPRLMASRFNFLSPRYYLKLHPFARKEALRSVFQLAGTLSTLLALASRVPGVTVSMNPTNPNWGKIRIGNTRIDLAGGFQGQLRLAAQIALGRTTSSTTGKTTSLTSGKFGQPTRLSKEEEFFFGKASPIAGLILDLQRGSNQIGQKATLGLEAQRLLPLIGQDSYDLYKENHGGMNGLAAAFAGYGLGSVGFGVQTYGPPAPKVGPVGGGDPYDVGGSGSGGGDPYDVGGSSGGGGDPYDTGGR